MSKQNCFKQATNSSVYTTYLKAIARTIRHKPIFKIRRSTPTKFCKMRSYTCHRSVTNFKADYFNLQKLVAQREKSLLRSMKIDLVIGKNLKPTSSQTNITFEHPNNSL